MGEGGYQEDFPEEMTLELCLTIDKLVIGK